MPILNWLRREKIFEVVKKTLFNKIKEKLFSLGTYNDTLLYNSILKNKLIIYGKNSKILKTHLKSLNIGLKQTPYDVKVR